MMNRWDIKRVDIVASKTLITGTLKMNRWDIERELPYWLLKYVLLLEH